MLSRSDAVYYYVHDYLGSIAATLDNRGEFVFAEQVYPYGEVKLKYEAGTATQQRFDFTGKERDSETGLHYYGARYYDSKLGIWLSVDPLLDKYPGLSPYNYCMNNPINAVDPDGRGVFITGKSADSTVSAMNQNLSYELRRDAETGLLTAYDSNGMLITSAEGYSGYEAALLEAMASTAVETELLTTWSNTSPISGDNFATGSFEGAKTINNLGISFSQNVFNLRHAKVLESVGGGSVGQSALHEIFEANYAGRHFPNVTYVDTRVNPFKDSHKYATTLIRTNEIPWRINPSGDAGYFYFQNDIPIPYPNGHLYHTKRKY